MKKLVSLIMVLALVLGLATAAFASEPAAGSDHEHPIVVNTLTEVNIPATGIVWYQLPNTYAGYTLSMADQLSYPTIYVYNEMFYYMNNGEYLAIAQPNMIGAVSYTLEAGINGVVFGIGSGTGSASVVPVTLTEPVPGSEAKPEIIEEISDDADNPTALVVNCLETNQGPAYYMTWTAAVGGEFYVDSVTGDFNQVMFSTENMGQQFWFDTTEPLSIGVFAGETVEIVVVGNSLDDITVNCHVEAAALGTVYNPIAVADQAKPYSFEAELVVETYDYGNGYVDTYPGTVYYKLSDVEGAILTIADPQASIEAQTEYGYFWFDSVQDDDEDDDVLTAQIYDLPNGEVVIGIASRSIRDEKYTVTVSDPEGFDENPEVLKDIAKIEAYISAFMEEGPYISDYYYNWTATESGKLSFSVSDAEWHEDIAEMFADVDVPVELTVLVNGKEAVAGTDAVTLNVVKGDVVTLAVAVSPLEDDEDCLPAYVTVAGAIDPLGSATNPIEIIDPADLGGIDVPAKGSVNYAINGKLNGQILTIKVDENATVTLNGEEVKAVNGVVTAVLDKTPVNTLTVANKGDKAASYVASINWPVGSESNPIVIESASDLTGVDVVAGESVYYAINSQLNGQILTINVDDKAVVTLNGKEVKAEDGVIAVALEGTPVNALVVTNKGEKDASYTASIAYELGTAGNPIAVNTEKELNGVKVAAGEEVHYLLNSKLEGAVLSVKGDKAYVIVNGEKTEAKDGIIKLTLAAKGATISLVVGGEATVTLGYSDNPNTGDAGIMAPIATLLVSAMSTVALVIKKKEF